MNLKTLLQKSIKKKHRDKVILKMDIVSLSCEKTCNNLQVHGTAMVEREKRRGQEKKNLNKQQIKFFKKIKAIKPKIHETQQISRRKAASSTSLPNC